MVLLVIDTQKLIVNEKLYKFIKENNLRICSDAYEEYPLNELSTKDESKYCVKIEIMVESDDR